MRGGKHAAEANFSTLKNREREKRMTVGEIEHRGGVSGLQRLIERVPEITQQRRRRWSEAWIRDEQNLSRISPAATAATPGDGGTVGKEGEEGEEATYCASGSIE